MFSSIKTNAIIKKNIRLGERMIIMCTFAHKS